MIKEFIKKKWVKNAGIALLCILCVYSLIYIDVVLRARSAYIEGEKYWQWHANPGQKEGALLAEFNKEKSVIDKKLEKGKITKEEYGRQLDILKFNHEEKLKESSIKYAYVWYQTAVELFSPPESRWVRLSREKMPKAKELWKKELTEKGIPFEDYMLE